MIEPVPHYWRVAQPDPEAVERIAAALNLSPLIARLLVNRGVVDAGAAQRFLNPRLDDLHDPHTLPEVDKAVERLARALENRERIFIHGDYDADGVTSAALCLRALSALGADVVGFVPSRLDGYDLQIPGVDRAKAAGASLILTADCGINAVAPVAYARELGIDVIVTDHHRPGARLPDAVAVVDPYRDDSTAPFRDLCGAGVAFKVLDALVARVAPAHRLAFRRNFVDLVALGTVADVTPLSGENRIFVSHGLRALAGGKKTGIRALLIQMGLMGQTLNTESISWKLGPRLNAAGRMEDADIAYRLLVTRDAAEAEGLVLQLAALAERSREETSRVTTEAMVDSLLPENADRRVLVLARERWGKGVVGIAASRLAEQCRRPVILLSLDHTNGHWHGSARSFGDFNLHQAFHQCAELLGHFGGHSASAGVSLPMDNLEAFRDRMHELAEGIISDTPTIPVLEIDTETDLNHVWTHDTLAQIGRLAPFGRENPEPVFATRGAVVLQARRVGKDQNTCLLQLRLPGTAYAMKAIWFHNGEWAERIGMGDEVDVVYTPQMNEYQGNSSIELRVHDLRLAI